MVVRALASLVLVLIAGCARPSAQDGEDAGGEGSKDLATGKPPPDFAGYDLRGVDLSTPAPGDMALGACPGKNLMTDPMNCGACGKLCMASHVAMNACVAGQCAVGKCSPGFYDVNSMVGDGCECEQEKSENSSTSQCAGAASAGMVTDAMASMITLTGSIVPVGDEDWYEIVGVDSPEANGGCNKYHLKIAFDQNPMNQFRFDVLYDDCKTKASCAMGEQSIGLTVYEFDANKGPMGGNECPCHNGKPPPGAHECKDHSQTVRIRVFRAMAAPPSCESYKLLVTNGV